jgi:hypothetical protein
VTPVLPQDIPKHWEWVEAGLKDIIRRTGEKWAPVHVLQALNEQRAHLFIDEDGFFVLQQAREDWTSAPVVHVWAMWFKPGTAREKESGLRDWLDDVTGRRVRMSSTRMGWGRMLGDEWEIERIIWRRKDNGRIFT